MSTRPKRAAGWACAVALAFASGAAELRAQEAAAPEESGSDASAGLFREGRTLLNKGRFAEACEKFRAALTLRRTPGTLLNVANCQESEGDVVAALESVEAALSLAVREPDQRKSAAWMAASRDEIAALEPRVAQLTVQASSEPAPAVTLDGHALGRFGVPIRLNPGSHSLEAAAPRRQAFVHTLELAAGQTETVTIPELALDTPALASQPAILNVMAPAEQVLPPSNVVPWSLIGAGSAVFVGGAITGVVARKRVADLKHDCPQRMCEGDLSQRDRAQTTALVADVLMGAGLVAAGVGVTLLLTGSAEPSPQVAVACGPGTCGAWWRGAF